MKLMAHPVHATPIEPPHSELRLLAYTILLGLMILGVVVAWPLLR